MRYGLCYGRLGGGRGVPPSQIVLLAIYLEMYNWQINQIRKEDTSSWSKKIGPVMLFSLLFSQKKNIAF